MVNSSQTALNALSFIEQYGPATTSDIAREQGESLLAVRSQMKSMAALGFVEEVGYQWRLTEAPRDSNALVQTLRSILKKHAGKKTRHIAREAGVDVAFLKTWLSSDGVQYFARDKQYRWYPLAENDQGFSSGHIEPEDFQADFISAALDKDLVVMAPPGTGKTHALVERLGWMSRVLTEPFEMAAICVLSFTNNAVNEITSRLGTMAERAESSDSVRYVSVRTFDSFATRCLADAGLTIANNFEENIKHFTEQLQSGFGQADAIPEQLKTIRWLFIDEVQDLSGERAQMVFALAEFLKANNDVKFAFLGDRHQGIYNHTTEFVQAENFMQLQQQILADRESLKFTFKRSYRYQDQVFSEFMGNARKLLELSKSPRDQRNDLAQVIPSLSALALDDWMEKDQVAILAGRNRTIARVAAALEQKGISFTVEDGSSSGTEWPLWIWQIFHNWQQPSMSRDVFYAKAKSYGRPDNLYTELQHQGLATADLIDVEQLSESVFSKFWRSIPDHVSEKKGVILSTIHKAKGLQYDNVLILTDDCGFAKDDQARLLYVAMTRAKKEVRGILSSDLCGENQGYFAKGMSHYYLDSRRNFAIENQDDLKAMLGHLTNAAGTFEAIFKLKNEGEHCWLCILGEGNCWYKVIRWYRQRWAFVPEETPLIPSRWTTIAWPDDAAIYRKILGPQLLLPLPVFTHGK